MPSHACKVIYVYTKWYKLKKVSVTVISVFIYNRMINTTMHFVMLVYAQCQCR